MDEFRKPTNHPFNNIRQLDLSYVPEQLIGRDREIKSLISGFKRVLEESERPNYNILVLGKGGIGKTNFAKWFANYFKSVAFSNGIVVKVEYFNCIHYRSKSKILRDLLAKYGKGSGRGYSDEEALLQIANALKKENIYLILIIDEIHLLSSEEVQSFVQIREGFRNENIKLSLFLISRTKDFNRLETQTIRKYIDHEITLQPYTYAQTLTCIHHRSDVAFGKNSIGKECLALIAQIAYTHQNLRHGIEILRKSAVYANKQGTPKITADMIREASNDVYPTFRGEIVDALTEQELCVLYSIAQGLCDEDKVYISIEYCYLHYKKLCVNYSMEIQSHSSYNQIIANLVQLEIIAREEKKDSERVTFLDIPSNTFLELLSEILELKKKNT
jgi:Cdc6-like AAA superfamily ATPase